MWAGLHRTLNTVQTNSLKFQAPCYLSCEGGIRSSDFKYTTASMNGKLFLFECLYYIYIHCDNMIKTYVQTQASLNNGCKVNYITPITGLKIDYFFSKLH